MPNYITITGVNCFKDIDGTPLAHGRLTITASDATGMSIEFSVPGEGIFNKRDVWRYIECGSLGGKSLQLANPAVTNPSKVGFTFMLEARRHEDVIWEVIAVYPAVDISSDSGIFDLSTLSAGNYLTAYPVSYVQGPRGPTGPPGPDIELTTTGSSGPSTLIDGVLNVPQYSDGGSGTVTSVSSADGNATVASPTTAPIISIVSAPKLATPRNINGVAFDGTVAITVAAAAGTLTGSALPSGVTSAPGLTAAAGGTFGTAAFTAASAYDASGAAAAATATAAQKASNLSDLASASIARTNLGLGTAATTSTTAYDAAGAASAAQTAATAAFTGDVTKTAGSFATTVAKVNGVAVTGTPSTGQVITATGTTAATWQSPSGTSMVYPGAGVSVSTGTAWGASKTTPTGNLVGDTDTQTLTNKTLTQPVIDAIITAGSAPTGVFGTGAGTGASALVITGNDTAGQIAFTSGTSPVTGGIVATLTFNATHATAPRFVIVQPVNTASASRSCYGNAYTATTWNFMNGASAVAPSTALVYGYLVIW